MQLEVIVGIQWTNRHSCECALGRGFFSVNICQVLGLDYEFSRMQMAVPGIPDFNCHYAGILGGIS